MNDKLDKPWSGKSEGMQKALGSLFSDYKKNIDAGKCATCGSTKIAPADFKSDLSRKEFTISGMCQKCQDGIWKQENTSNIKGW